MKFDYSRTRIPPELFVPVRIYSFAQTSFFPARGKLDTGADITVIPENARMELKLFPRSLARIKNPWDGSVSEKSIYYITITVADAFEFDLKALAWQKDYCLIGRDLLNQIVLQADGPAGVFEINLPE